MNKKIVFTKHAREKFAVLAEHNFFVSERDVLLTIVNAEGFDFSREPLIIAQRKINASHYLRVVFKKEYGEIKVITFYPGRIKQYVKRIYKTKN